MQRVGNSGAGVQGFGAELRRLVAPLASGISWSYSWLVICGSQLASGRAGEASPLCIFCAEAHPTCKHRNPGALQLWPSTGRQDGGGHAPSGSGPIRMLWPANPALGCTGYCAALTLSVGPRAQGQAWLHLHPTALRGAWHTVGAAWCLLD